MPQPWLPSDVICAWLREKYAYDAVTGEFRFRATDELVSLQRASNGYLNVRLTNLALGVRRYVSAHRLAWFLHHGRFPALEIDHIDRVKTNNAIANLREASRSENHGNGPKKVRRTGGSFSSHFRGVFWSKKDRRWMAQIKVAQKIRHLGSFRNEEDAARAYNVAASELFGEFANLNSVA